jgi:hypothetical protein
MGEDSRVEWLHSRCLRVAKRGTLCPTEDLSWPEDKSIQLA